MKRTLLLLLALLCMLPAAHAAGPETLYPIAYCFRETDFRADTLSDLNGIFVTSVPEADVATVCLGERVIRAGDVLPVSVLGELELLPVSTGGQEAALCYCPIRGTALGEPAQVTIRIRSAKDAAPKADDAELETYKNIPNDGRLTGSDPEDTNLTFQLAEEPKRGKVELQENGSFVYTPAKNKVGEDSFTFTVTDAAGNVSHPATVRITVKKPSECRACADLTGSLDQCEAMWTAAAGRTGGRSIGGHAVLSAAGDGLACGIPCDGHGAARCPRGRHAPGLRLCGRRRRTRVAPALSRLSHAPRHRQRHGLRARPRLPPE